MAFAQVATNLGGSSSSSTAPAYVLPATINAGEIILIIAGTDNVALHTVPTGFTEITQQNGVFFQFQVFGKIAAGTEGGTTVTGTLAASESMCYQCLILSGHSGSLSDIEFNTIVTSATGTSVDPGSITATWGIDDNLFIAIAIGDLYNDIATGFPTNYTDNNLTQQHSDAFGGTQAVSLATRELAAATDDPSAFTMATGNPSAALTLVVKPAAAGDTIDTIDNPVLDAEAGNAATYTDFATASINAVTVDGIAGSSVVDDDAGNVTWTNPSIMAIALGGGGAIPDFGTVAVEFTNGTETGSANTTFSEAAGFSTVTLAAIDTVSADYLYQLLLGVGITIANGEEIYYNNQSGQFTITADGGIVSTVSTSTLTNIKAGPVVTDMVTWINGSVVTSTNNSIFKSIYGSIYK